MKNKLKKSNIMILAVLAALWLSGCDKSKSESSPPLPPEAPQNLAATDGTYGNQVQLSWDASTGAQSYKVYKAIDSVNGEYRLVTSGVAGTEWADTTVTVSRMYYYAIMAVNSGGTSPMSVTDLGYAGALAKKPPFPPAGLVATGDYLHHVYLQWDPVTGADRYHVYRSDSINGVYSKITDSDGLTTAELDGIEVDGVDYSFDDTSTAEGRAYYYKVSAEDDVDGEGLACDPVMGWFPYDAPDIAPAGVAASDGDYSNKVMVSWEGVPEADEYVVYRSLGTYESTDCPTMIGSYTSIGKTSSLSYDDAGLGAGDYNVYCYAVSAKNSAGESDISEPDKGSKSSSGTPVPASPFDLEATTDETNQITVTWTRADAYATEYEVFRSTAATGDYGADPVGEVADNGSASYSYADTTVTTNTTYYYKVRAVSAGGNSALSGHTSGSALPAVPTAPTVTASDGADWDSITVTWTEAPRAVTYKLYRSTSASGPWDATTLLANKLTGTSYTDTSGDITNTDPSHFHQFKFDTTYYYAVRGVNTGGDGAVGTNGGNVELATPAAPTIGDPGYQDFSITWTVIEGCQGYIVHWVRSTVAWGTTAGSNTGQINVPGNSSTTTTLLNGTLYYNYRFRVQAYVTDGGGNITHYGPIGAWSGWENAD